MRERKFWGKSKDNGEWIVGYYAYKDLTDEHFIIVPTFDLHSTNRPQYFTDHLVEGDTVFEFTGMRDIKGKDIYEGDIVQLTNKGNALVVWLDGCFAVVFEEPPFEMNGVESYVKRRDYLKTWVINRAIESNRKYI